MGFFGSLFGGSNPTLNSGINNVGNIAGFASGQGQGDLTSASKFWQSILSGDPSKISQSLAPEISANQKQGQEAKNQLAQFGTRSGGTASAGAGIDAAGRGNMINLIGGLQSGAASNLGSMGSSLLNTGLQGYGEQADMSQQRMQNWINSILGGVTTSAVNKGMSFLHM